MERAGVDAAEEACEHEGGEDDEGEEARAVVMVEAVAGFEVRRSGGWCQETGVEQAVGGVDHPDG